jgi:subfamily B ATP-binding cassette protein MsbA
MPQDVALTKPGLSVLDLLRPHKRQIFWGFVAITGESIADVLQPLPIKIVLDDLLKGKNTHGWLDQAIERVVGTNPAHVLEFACAMVIVIALVDAACSYWDKFLTSTVGQWVSHDLRTTIYTQVQRLSLAFHDQQPTGDLISRVTVDIDNIQTFIVSGLLGILVDVMTIVGYVVMMFCLNWQFTFIALAVVPVLFVLVYTYTRKVKKASREVRKQEGRMVSVVQEVVTSMRVVKAFAREDYEVKRFEGESVEAVEAALRARAMKARLVPLVNIIVAIGTAAVLWFGARLHMRHAISAGTIVVFILYLGKMYKPMQDISKMMDSYSRADIGFERIQEIARSHEEILDAPNARVAPRFKGKIDLEHVDFCYKQGEQILKDVNIHVGAGTMVALVGATGSGKTTIANLIARFYDPNNGVVKIDDTDIKLYTQKSLRNQISFVLQDTVLFSGTIWDNIAYGRPDATQDQIVKAAEAANALEFIEKLPQKFDTEVGEKGVTLSGGQRQRIAIARAIIRNTPILVLDEPTSGLDAESEHLVFEALDRLMEHKTSVVIAHRLSTIRRACCIYVVQDGGIVESGTHDELLARPDGVYHKLHEIQFSEQEIAPAMA